MKELRNFISHHSHINLISRIHLEKGKKDVYEKIPKTEIEDYLNEMIEKNPKWQGLKSAKEFLSSQNEIRLNELIDRYDEEVMNLYKDILFSTVRKYTDALKSFIEESQELQQQAREINFELEYPVIGAKLRYVNYLISKI